MIEIAAVAIGFALVAGYVGVTVFVDIRRNPRND